jgi:hypothetical protein
MRLIFDAQTAARNHRINHCQRKLQVAWIKTKAATLSWPPLQKPALLL